MSNEYYNPSGSPSTGSAGASATMRSEFAAVQAGFALLPTLLANGSLPIFVNAGATALEATTPATARTRLGLGSISTQDANNVSISGGTVKGVSALTTNNAAITGGTITGLSQLASNNVTITGGTISGVGLGTMSTQNANNVAITGGTISGVGLGTMSTQNANNVAITGGTITGLSQLGSNNATITGGTISAGVAQSSPVNNSLSGNVALNNASIYFDGPVVAQGNNGVWFVSGSVSAQDTTGAANFDAKLTDGTTVIDSKSTRSVTASRDVVISLSGFISNPAGNLRISVRDLSSASGLISFNSSGNGKDSSITAMRIG